MTVQHFDRDFYQSYMETTYDRASVTYDNTVDYWWRDGRDPRLFMEALIDENLHPAAEVLDVATGTGRIALGVAPQVPEGRVIGIDQAEQMLRVAADKADEAGLTNVTFQHYAVESELPFPDASFDLVTCSLAMVYFQDRPAFIREAGRVLKPGGALVVNTIGPGDMRDALRPFWDIFVRYLPNFSSDFRPHTPPEEMAGWYTDAGLADVQTFRHNETVVFRTRDDYLQLWRMYGVQGVLFFLPRSTARQVVDEYVALLDSKLNGRGELEVGREIVTGIGRRPA